jgi:HD-GYP domain-containing protein (c-di-GMP phosphodiesterase class II)
VPENGGGSSPKALSSPEVALSDIARLLVSESSAEQVLGAVADALGELVPYEALSLIPIVRASHERWDGRGYPDGAAGEDIALESRIVFVCDAFHAMVTDRSYRAALPEKEAIRRLKLASGSQFDPMVVGAFVQAHEQGRIHFH